MSLEKQNQAPSDIREFFKFLKGLWGMLSSISILFPLSNVLVRAIRIKQEDIPLYTVMATLSSIFCVFFLYSSREKVLDKKYRRLSESGKEQSRKRALSSFVFGIIFLVVYLFLYGTYSVSSSERIPIQIWLTWFVNLTLYTSTFVMFTAAFTHLAILEYLEQIQVPSENLRLIDKINNLTNQNSFLSARLEKQTRQIAKLQELSADIADSKSLEIFRGRGGIVETSIIKQAIKSDIERQCAIRVLLIDIVRLPNPNSLFNFNSVKSLVDGVSCTISVLVNDPSKAIDINTHVQNTVRDTIRQLGLNCIEVIVHGKEKQR